jgi:hypothetical protein
VVLCIIERRVFRVFLLPVVEDIYNGRILATCVSLWFQAKNGLVVAMVVEEAGDEV